MKRYRVAFYESVSTCYNTLSYVIWGNENESWLKFSTIDKTFHFPEIPINRAVQNWDFDDERIEITEI